MSSSSLFISSSAATAGMASPSASSAVPRFSRAARAASYRAVTLSRSSSRSLSAAATAGRVVDSGSLPYNVASRSVFVSAAWYNAVSSAAESLVVAPWSRAAAERRKRTPGSVSSASPTGVDTIALTRVVASRLRAAATRWGRRLATSRCTSCRRTSNSASSPGWTAMASSAACCTAPSRMSRSSAARSSSGTSDSASSRSRSTTAMSPAAHTARVAASSLTSRPASIASSTPIAAAVSTSVAAGAGSMS